MATVLYSVTSCYGCYVTSHVSVRNNLYILRIYISGVTLTRLKELKGMLLDVTENILRRQCENY
jgi:hypothetical protein